MDQNEEKREKLPLWQKRQLALALAGTALLAVVMVSLAWLNFNRSLQTITRLEMPILWLKDKTGNYDAVSIELGNLNTSSEGSKDFRFAVLATADTTYLLQLAHTTNIPLTYSIIRTDANGGSEAEKIIQQVTDEESTSYGDYTNAQVNAMPEYWQTKDRFAIGRNDLHYYTLRVTWKDAVASNKESDMIYLTVATAIEDAANTTGGNT